MRHIGRADTEFYEGLLVMKVAHALAGGADRYGTLSDLVRKKRLEAAIDVVHALLNDEDAMARLIKSFKDRSADT